MGDMPARILFDVHAITPTRSGIGEYSLHLLRALCDQPVEMILFSNGRCIPMRSASDIEEATRDIADASMYSPLHLWELSMHLRSGGYDLLHMPDYITPPHIPLPLVCTIYDLIPLMRPEYIRRSLKVRLLPLYRMLVRRALRRSVRIITISEHSRNDIRRMFPKYASRIDVTPLAATIEAKRTPLTDELRGRIGARPYLLYVGRHDPYKGLGLLLEAFARAREDAGFGDTRLLIVGKQDARYPYLDTVEALGVHDDVVFLGYVDSASMPSLYSNALAFVFPSLYEGFGLPPLDAMGLGVPVICSDRASLPEVVGDAAVRIDPENTDEFSAALLRIVTDTALRNRLSEQGIERHARFSWNVTASLTVKTYMHALHD